MGSGWWDCCYRPDDQHGRSHPCGITEAALGGDIGYGVRPEVRNGALYTIPALGGTPTLLLPPHGAGVAVSPAWSPDATRVACCDDGVYVIGASGGSPRLIVTAARAHSPRWSADGTQLAYVSVGVGPSLSAKISSGTPRPARFTSSQSIRGPIGSSRRASGSTSAPAWTPDDRGLLFVSNRSGGRDVYRQRLSRSGAPEGEPERVTSGLNAHAISLSPDGKLLAYSSLTFHANIWSLPIPREGVAPGRRAAGDIRQRENREARRVPDGQWLAFDSDRSGNADVWKVRIAGGEPEQVTAIPARSSSTTGRRMAWRSFFTRFAVRPTAT